MGEQEAEIFDAHLTILGDEYSVREPIIQRIREQKQNAAAAIEDQFDELAQMFRSLGDGLCNIGLGLFSTGLGILFVYGAILLFKWLIRKASVSLGKITKGGRRNEKNN